MLSFDIVLFGVFFSAQKKGMSEFVRRTGVHVFAFLVAIHSLAVLACITNLISISLYVNILALGITLGTFLLLGLVHLTRGLSAELLEGFFNLLYGSGVKKIDDIKDLKVKCDAELNRLINRFFAVFLRSVVMILLIALSWLGKYLFDEDLLGHISVYSISWVVGVLSTLLFMKYSFGAFLPMTSCRELSANEYERKLTKLIKRARQAIFCSTFGFSTIETHPKVTRALSDARARGISITVLGDEKIMEDTVKKRLYEIGSFLYLTQEKILEMNNTFWNHIFIVDGIHWLWLFPHTPKPHPQESEAHQGYLSNFDTKAESYLDHFKIIPRKRYPALEESNKPQEAVKSN